MSRTAWWPKDAGWHRRERIVELGHQFGPAGPMVLDWLSCEARTQNPPRTGTGRVKTGYAAIAHGCFLQGGVDEARAIVRTCVEIGALDDFVELAGGRMFEARVSGWHEDVNRPLDAVRKAEERAARKPDGAGPSGPEQGDGGPDGAAPAGAEQGPDTTPVASQNGRDVRARPTVSQDVHDVHGRPLQDRTGQDRNRGSSSLRSDELARASANDEDEWPERLPDRLRPVAEHVWERLGELAEIKKVDRPSRKRVGFIVADFPDHDHQAAVADVVDFWAFGRGARTHRKDLARVYRDWCKRIPEAPLATVHRHPAAHRRGAGPVANPTAEQIQAARERALARQRSQHGGAA